jgi:hypothetical protein
MNMRSTGSTVTFSKAFPCAGYPGDLPAGDDEILVEGGLLQGPRFEAHRRTAREPTVRGGAINWDARRFARVLKTS